MEFGITKFVGSKKKLKAFWKPVSLEENGIPAPRSLTAQGEGKGRGDLAFLIPCVAWLRFLISLLCVILRVHPPSPKAD